jgi:integrase
VARKQEEKRRAPVIYKREDQWHCDFTVDGVRYRQSLKTTDGRAAKAEEKKLIALAEAGKLAREAKRKGVARLMFKDAAERFTADRVADITTGSAKTERERARAVNRVLGSRVVASISPDDVLAYIRERKEQGKSNATVNRELDIIRGVLKKAKRWHRFADEVKPLSKTENIGRVLSYDEQVKLLHVAAMRPAWQSAYYAAVLAFNTTCRGCELKGIQWRDVNLSNRSVAIRRSKTAAGHRVIPLNADALRVVMQLYRRAETMGGPRPDDYLFFACERGKIDPSRPQKSWRTAWRSLTEAAGLKGLRFHDVRHHAITELAESQTSDSTIMSIAGHVSRKMLEHYSHIRLEAKRTALDGISGTKGSCVTNHVTNRENSPEQVPQVIESMVELVGIEPTASSLRTTRSPS